MSLRLTLLLAASALHLLGTATPALAAPPSITVSPSPSITGNSVFALSTEGRLYAWGSDAYGQLGLGRLLSSPVFVRVGTGYKAVAAGDSHIVALKTDGSVWAWGQNSYGQLGDGTQNSRSVPVKIGDGYKAVAAATAYTLGIKQDGTLWMWGQGFAGDGNVIFVSYLPRQIGEGYTAVAAGSAHTMALKADGSLYVWGSNAQGQLGVATSDVCNPGTNSSYTCSFTKRLLGTGYTAMAAGGATSYAVRSDGSLWAWGNNSEGQLGDGTTQQRAGLVQIGSGFAAVSAYGTSAAALTTSGSVYQWGGYTTNLPTKTGDGFTRIAQGVGSILAVKADNSLWGRGGNEQGMLGDGGTAAVATFKQVGSDVAVVTASKASSALVKTDGSLWVAGSNGFGQLGLGDMASRSSPGLVGSGFTSVSTGGFYGTTWASKSDGSRWAWGDNRYGEFGDGTTASSNVPKRIGTDTGFVMVSGNFALKSDGSLWGWGSNVNGELGLGRSTLTEPPTKLGDGYAAVSSGGNGYTTLALKTDGSLWAWGMNWSGQLGYIATEGCNGTLAARPCSLTPKLVGTGYRAVSVGYAHTLALKLDGTLWAWGDNSAGQLGVASADLCVQGTNYTAVNVTNAMPCALLPKLVGSGFTAMSAGYQHSLATKADGSLWAWGTNYWGYLGDGNRTGSIVAPKQVATGFVGIAAGGYQSLAYKADGTTWSWGQNMFGNLGDGTLANRLLPTLVVNDTLDGVMDLLPAVPNNIAPDKLPSFFLVASGGVTSTSGSVSTLTKFNAADVGKPGAVFVSAMVPPNTLVPGTLANTLRRQAQAGSAAYVPVQLTASGWQPVVNGQLLPYASGVLGDQLAAQTILNSTSTVALKGSEFCVGYGTSASEMSNSGRIRSVATVPLDQGSTAASAPTCTTTAVIQPADCLFNWAENTFPDFFAPKGGASVADGPNYLRSFNKTGATLGINAGNLVYVGPISGGAALSLGAATDWYGVAGCK